MNLRKLSASTAVISILILSMLSILATLAHATSLNYSQFSLAPGDATYTCQGVTLNQNDMAMTASSLTSNVNKKAAQIHAYSSYKQYVSISTILYSIQFSIPYQPKPDTTQTYNAQTIESEVAIWRGDAKVKYNSAIQWVLNPWQIAHINVWRNGIWVSVANLDIVQNDLYRYTVYLSIQNPSASYAKLEHQIHFFGWVFWSQIGMWQSYSSQSFPSWGSDFSWWVSAENISASPDCSLSVGFINKNNWYSPSVVVT